MGQVRETRWRSRWRWSGLAALRVGSVHTCGIHVLVSIVPENLFFTYFRTFRERRGFIYNRRVNKDMSGEFFVVVEVVGIPRKI